MSTSRSVKSRPIDYSAESSVARALAAPAMYRGHPTVRVHETHASLVFLAGDRAYKIKKPVRLAFLDYSTLAARHAACLEEVRINRELAPDIYLGVSAIVRASGGGFRFASEGTPGAVEYAVVMRRFDEAHTLQGAIRARSLTRTQICQVARRLADFHNHAPALAVGSPAQLLKTWMANIEEIERLDTPPEWRMEVMRGFGEAFVSAHAREIELRGEQGCVRDGHGDLRCEHVLLGPPVRVVDRIEFDPTLRQLDVACDLAFLTMDLEAHRRHGAAQNLVRAYRRAGGSPGSNQLRDFYGAYWALVRAKVALIAAASGAGRARWREEARAGRLWKLAERLCWRARSPVAIAVCGTAASGKSTLAAELSRRSGFPVVSSDAVRKRHAGLEATERARPEHYTGDFTKTTYELLTRSSLSRLDRKGAVIVDATCHTKSERAQLFESLHRSGATFLVVRCKVTLQTALERASARMQSPGRISDATPQIVAEQFARFEALSEIPAASALVLDTEQDLDAQVAELAIAVDTRMLAVRALSARAGAVYPVVERQADA